MILIYSIVCLIFYTDLCLLSLVFRIFFEFKNLKKIEFGILFIFLDCDQLLLLMLIQNTLALSYTLLIITAWMQFFWWQSKLNIKAFPQNYIYLMQACVNSMFGLFAQ